MRIAFLVAPGGVEQVELTEPWQAVADAGDTPVLVSTKPGRIQAFQHLDKGDTFPVDRTVDETAAGDYDALVLPGGVANPDFLRMDEQAVAFVRAFFDAGKPVAAICHAPWTLVEADVVRGRELTSWPSLRTDIRNAGGILGGRAGAGVPRGPEPPGDQPQAGGPGRLLLDAPVRVPRRAPGAGGLSGAPPGVETPEDPPRTPEGPAAASRGGSFAMLAAPARVRGMCPAMRVRVRARRVGERPADRGVRYGGWASPPADRGVRYGGTLPARADHPATHIRGRTSPGPLPSRAGHPAAHSRRRTGPGPVPPVRPRGPAGRAASSGRRRRRRGEGRREEAAGGELSACGPYSWSAKSTSGAGIVSSAPMPRARSHAWTTASAVICAQYAAAGTSPYDRWTVRSSAPGSRSTPRAAAAPRPRWRPGPPQQVAVVGVADLGDRAAVPHQGNGPELFAREVVHQVPHRPLGARCQGRPTGRRGSRGRGRRAGRGLPRGGRGAGCRASGVTSGGSEAGGSTLCAGRGRARAADRQCAWRPQRGTRRRRTRPPDGREPCSSPI